MLTPTVGNGTQANLYKLGVDVRELSGLLFTHHHLDHNEEFIPIFIHFLLGRDNFKIIGPPNTVKLTEANLGLYAEDISYRLGKTKRIINDRQRAFSSRDIQGGESFIMGGIRVSTIKVPHTIYAIAYRFDFNGQSIVVTGDLTYSEKLSELAKDADFMIIDSGGMIMKGGPLFADNARIALNLFNGLSDHAAGEAIFIDVPEINKSAMKIVNDKYMREVFGCARMCFGDKPKLPDSQIYAVTTFELG